ncbi:MAG: helix-turn-helix domain-containing protein [Terrisporobacter sp.]
MISSDMTKEEIIENYYTPKEAAQLLKVKYDNFLIRYVSAGYFESTVQINKNYFIKKSELDPIIKEQNEYYEMENYFITDEIVMHIRLNRGATLQLINKDKFRSAKIGKFHKCEWKIDKNEVKDYIIEKINRKFKYMRDLNLLFELDEEKYLSINEAAIKMDENLLWLKSNLDMFKDKCIYKMMVYINKQEVLEMIKINEILTNNSEQYINIEETSRILKTTDGTVRSLIRNNKFPNIIIFENPIKVNPNSIRTKYAIPISDIDRYVQEVKNKKLIKEKLNEEKKEIESRIIYEIIKQRKIENEELSKDINDIVCISKTDSIDDIKLKSNFAELMELENKYISKKEKNKFNKISFIENQILDQKSKISNMKILMEEEKNKNKELMEIDVKNLFLNGNTANFYTMSEVADLFKISVDAVKRCLIDRYKLKTVIYQRKIHIHKNEIESYSKCDIIIYVNKETTIEEKWDYYKPKFHRYIFYGTIELMEKYFTLKVKASTQDVHTYSMRIISTFLKVLKILHKDIFYYSDDEIIEIIGSDTLLTLDKKVFISFINYVRTQVKFCAYENKYNFTSKTDVKVDKDIYTRKQFKDIYDFVNKVHIHQEKAIEDSQYAESWFYLALHLANTWRTKDIIKFPHTEFEFKDKSNKNSLLNMELDIDQAQHIVNTVQETHLFTINKTDGLNKFFSHIDMVITIATIISILEYHYSIRKSKNKSIFYHLSKNSKRNDIINDFLNKSKNLKNIKFDNTKSNRTLLTYFHHNVSRGSKNSDIVNILDTRLRGHINENTVNQYVMNVNKDEYIDEISLHLFRRGYFGWMYNSLTEIITCSKKKMLTLEEKTLIIEKYQNIYTHQNTEKISKFFLTQQNKLKSVALEIASMPDVELFTRLEKVFWGYMPSKEENCQCIYSRECKKSRSECSLCPYIIPKIYFLKSVKTELNMVMSNIANEKNYNVNKRIKLTSILFRLLGIVNQATSEFGEKYVNSFINLQELNKKLELIEDKFISIEKGV